MDELSNIEARRDVNVANLRRAFQPLALGADAADRACPFAALLGRLAGRLTPSTAASDRSRPRSET